jgi:hypothetical protein
MFASISGELQRDAIRKVITNFTSNVHANAQREVRYVLKVCDTTPSN